ncbi:hypothetical protein PAESOLCIP111_06360 [Paenibacillus solanacearum]|uniref:Uncharacterized protein n=1 Tax=Paenibacillus solanacearum TaxID=2048548 RepID=A0A916KAS9_9BACL|nr:hypothetical protein PAESOLCIP111_06360 [Paenibacillus solanacearum]
MNETPSRMKRMAALRNHSRSALTWGSIDRRAAH